MVVPAGVADADSDDVYAVSSFDEFKASSVGSLREGYYVALYDTDDDEDGYEVLIYCKDGAF